MIQRLELLTKKIDPFLQRILLGLMAIAGICGGALLYACLVFLAIRFFEPKIDGSHLADQIFIIGFVIPITLFGAGLVCYAAGDTIIDSRAKRKRSLSGDMTGNYGKR